MAAVELLLALGAVALPGNDVPLVLGEYESDSGLIVEARLDLRVGLAVEFEVGVLATAGASGRAGLGWGRVDGAGTGTADRLPWRGDGDQVGVPTVLPWAPFGGPLVAGRDALPWGAATAVPARADQLPWGVAQALAYATALRWGRPGQAHAGGALPWGAAQGLAMRAGLGWRLAGQAWGEAAVPWGDAESAGVRAVWPWGLAQWVVAPNVPLPRAPGPIGLVPRGDMVHLHFCVLVETASLDLVLGREECVRRPRIPGGLAIGSRRSYVMTHALLAQRLPDLLALPVTSVDLEADADSYGWTSTMTGRPELLADLAPVGGEPARVRVTLDGMVWELVVEGLRRNRAFGRTSATVTARSAGVLLGAPYAAERSWLNAVPMTAKQVIEEALFGTDVLLDWQCTDWLLPAGAWSMRGAPLAVARRVADAIGAVLASPRAGDVLVVAPRYPVLPWHWGDEDPDVTIALDAVVVEGHQRADRPPYEGVYVSGESQGVLALVKRTGTAPALLLPLVTDPMITDLDAARQRGEALLGAVGKRADMTLTLPVLTGPGEPGVIDPGRLVEVVDPAGSWRGLVRRVQVSGDHTTVRQTLGLERHL